MDSWLKTGSLLERKRKSENNKNPPNKMKKINIIPEISKTADNVTLVSPSSSNSNIESKKWPVVWNESQWIEFKEKYPWIVGADGK
ncbi:unnamed protein product [Macrosiphum euphorbiae]|uniref:Uncharacterized protein n=1 Tax=Macrosiphum euphorbiae TaxID=13131 RepID=A0AAV0XMI4_9HEMI|nr:unnamed protein product [Macrosiphum euphorbiae]